MEVNRNDRRLLLAALASNGGGIRDDMHPAAAVARLSKQGLIQSKPNQYRGTNIDSHLLTLTDAGKKAAMELK